MQTPQTLQVFSLVVFGSVNQVKQTVQTPEIIIILDKE